MPSHFDKIVEKVPTKFLRRQGDIAYEGGNNTLLVMGTDRPGSANSGLGHANAQGKGKETGTIHMVVGRKTADPDFAQDAAFIYISQKTNADENLGTGGIQNSSQAKPAIIAKSTDLRLGARENVKIYMDDANKDKYIFLDSQKTVVSMTPDSVLTLTKNDATLKVKNTTIQIQQDGSVIINAGTQNATITAQTLAVNGNLTVSGQAAIQGAVSAASVASAGAMTGANINISGPATIDGPTKIQGIDIKNHIHPVAGVKGGPDTIPTKGPQ